MIHLGVAADLLLDGATDVNKKVFNILCEHPETVAAYMVPRVRTVVARGNTGSYIRYLTIPRALLRFVTAPLNANRYFDSAGALPDFGSSRCLDGVLSPAASRRCPGMWMDGSLFCA